MVCRKPFKYHPQSFKQHAPLYNPVQWVLKFHNLANICLAYKKRTVPKYRSQGHSYMHNHNMYNKNFVYPCNLNGAFSRAKYYLVKNSIAEKEAKVDAMVLERRYGIFC